jgi:hypothetical protein
MKERKDIMKDRNKRGYSSLTDYIGWGIGYVGWTDAYETAGMAEIKRYFDTIPMTPQEKQVFVNDTSGRCSSDPLKAALAIDSLIIAKWLLKNGATVTPKHIEYLKSHHQEMDADLDLPFKLGNYIRLREEKRDFQWVKQAFNLFYSCAPTFFAARAKGYVGFSKEQGFSLQVKEMKLNLARGLLNAMCDDKDPNAAKLCYLNERTPEEMNYLVDGELGVIAQEIFSKEAINQRLAQVGSIKASL